MIPVVVINLANCTGSIPNFILAFIPAEVNGDTLNTMTAFAVRGIVYFKITFNQAINIQTGGLLSDVFLHLVPHSFMGENQGSGVHFVMVEEKRNILIGSAFDHLTYSCMVYSLEFFAQSRHIRGICGFLFHGEDSPRSQRR